ncbi:MAG: fasciclin domain-containing protein [Polyangiales bacterium]|jgi:uncharacterized surface protein with fasciclin (FAS1) repeats
MRLRLLLSPLLVLTILLGCSKDATKETTTAAKSTVTDMAADPDIVTVAVTAGDFNTLVAALKAADLVATLQGEGPFTVFAPTDEAFAALPAGTVDSLLLPENKAKLVSILTYHVVQGKVLAADVVNLSSADTVEGEALAITSDASGVHVNQANVVKADIMASNGVIHVIDAVLIP